MYPNAKLFESKLEVLRSGVELAYQGRANKQAGWIGLE